MYFQIDLVLTSCPIEKGSRLTISARLSAKRALSGLKIRFRTSLSADRPFLQDIPNLNASQALTIAAVH